MTTKPTGFEIYLIPVGQRFGLPETKVQIAYAPLQGVYTLLNEQEASALQSVLNTAEDPSASEFLSEVRNRRELPLLPAPPTTDDIWEVDFLLNNICNFHCSYCYSAAGRSNKRMPQQAWKKSIDFIFDKDKESKIPLKINFSGGGEPLISFQEIKNVIHYIEEKYGSCKRPYKLGIVSNGSLLTDEIIHYVHDKQIKLVISFEILPELQNRERGSYDKVKSNLLRMHDLGCPFGIRTPLTEDALPYLPQMLEEMHRTYPFLDSLVVEPVHSPEWYGTPDKLQAYFDLFYTTFTNALPIAKKLGINLCSNAFSLLKYRRKSKCLCKMVITAEGTISHCARVASATEPLYHDFVYGTCNTPDNAPVSFNQEMFQKINKRNIFDQPECRECYARWNCGGDCSLFRQTYPAECFEISCRFTRKCLIWEMLRNIQTAFEQNQQGRDFDEYVRSST